MTASSPATVTALTATANTPDSWPLLLASPLADSPALQQRPHKRGRERCRMCIGFRGKHACWLRVRGGSETSRCSRVRFRKQRVQVTGSGHPCLACCLMPCVSPHRCQHTRVCVGWGGESAPGSAVFGAGFRPAKSRGRGAHHRSRAHTLWSTPTHPPDYPPG